LQGCLRSLHIVWLREVACIPHRVLVAIRTLQVARDPEGWNLNTHSPIDPPELGNQHWAVLVLHILVPVSVGAVPVLVVVRIGVGVAMRHISVHVYVSHVLMSVRVRPVAVTVIVFPALIVMVV